MSLVDLFRARLAGIDPAAFAVIEDAAALAAIEGVPMALPAAYVFVKEEASDPTERMTGPVLQRCEVDVAVLIVTSNMADHRGGSAARDIETLKAAVRAALIGWIPEPAVGEPVQHVSGQFIRFRAGTVWHEEVYGTATYIEEQAS
jgi:hypothetical protein